MRGVIPPDRAGDFNQALIEVGALVCIPGESPSARLPFHSLCLARRRGLTGEIPVKAPKKARRIERRRSSSWRQRPRWPSAAARGGAFWPPSGSSRPWRGTWGRRRPGGVWHSPRTICGGGGAAGGETYLLPCGWHMRGIRIRLTAPVQAPADGGRGELIFADKGELWTCYPCRGHLRHTAGLYKMERTAHTKAVRRSHLRFQMGF